MRVAESTASTIRYLRLACCAAALVVACARYSGPPDANFAKARDLYSQLYAAELDEAYGDARMDEVVALLGKVHKRSVDAPSAQALLRVIEKGREELAKANAEREKLREAAAAEIAATRSTIDPSRVLEQPDAGPEQDPFGPGASIAEINRDTGGCLVSGEEFKENGTNKSGKVYRLVSNAACKQKLPGFVGQVVMVENGKIYRRISESDVPHAPARASAAPDAGVASSSRPPGAARESASADAGVQQAAK
jgi:hypothetical protein